MSLGINIAEDVRVHIGEIKEQLLDELNNKNISYSIPFDKTNNDNVRETIITMRDPDIEISVNNDIVVYIKSDNTEFTCLDVVEDISSVNIVEHIKTIQKHVVDKLGINEADIKIEKIDTQSLNMTLIINNNNNKVRLQIVRDTFGNIYMNTIMVLK